MKKILILGLLLVSHLWGLKKWSGGITDRYYKCTWCKTERPKLPDDYKPQKGDRVIKVKVGKTEGIVINVPNKGLFIKTSNEKSYLYSGSSSSEIFFVDYPNYIVVASISNGTGGSGVDFFQIFAVDDRLKMFQVLDKFELGCDYDKDSPCPFTKEYILDWIKKQGGQKYFDEACPAYYDDLNDECRNGLLE